MICNFQKADSFSGSCTIQILVTLQLKLNKCPCIQRKNVNLTIS